MTKYIVLLRGINVSGQKIIKMEELRKFLASCGYKNVKTYIQSGNIIFDYEKNSHSDLTDLLKSQLIKFLGYEVIVFVRSLTCFEKIIKNSAFNEVRKEEDSKPYVTFLQGDCEDNLQLPYWSPNKDVEIIDILECQIYSYSHLYKGRSAFPNKFIEKELGKPATTRNWNTINKIYQLCLD